MSGEAHTGYRAIACLVAATLSSIGCDDTPRVAGTTADGGVSAEESDAGSARVDAGLPAFSSLAGRTLDGLGVREVEVLCAEQLRRVDRCKMVALSTTKTVDDCNRTTAECHAVETEAGLEPACRSVHFGSAGDCPVTTDEYASCLDAWNAALSCDGAGFIVGTPKGCANVVASCPKLAADFQIPGLPPPCKPEERVSRPDTTDDVYGLDPCPPVPSKLVVLGDSIADCTGVMAAECAPHILAEHLKTTVAPDLVLESHARAGARIHDLLTQMEQVTPGPGHVFVFIYAVGNDIIAADFDAAALGADYERMFDYFTDAKRFPDGATFLLNTQYTPLDECFVPGAQQDLPASAVPLMIALNQTLFIDVAKARPDAVAVDQYPDFLGHGVNGNISGCPYCSTDNTPWSDDGLHPNKLGHAHIAEQWIHAVDAMFAANCAQ